MAESTVVYTPENNGGSMNNLGALGFLAPMLQNAGLNSNLLYPLLLMGGGGLGFGGFGGGGLGVIIIAVIALIALFRGGALGGNGANASALMMNTLNDSAGRDMLMQAINGNQTAISQLAQTFGCTSSQITGAINQAQQQIQGVGNQVGMSGMQVINAIQQGNASLAAQLSQSCCETRNAITTQGYESRLATLQQTDAISAKIAEQTQIINDKFCELEKREMQSKIDALAQQNTILRGTIDNANQTAAIQGFVGAQLAPINAHLTELNREVDDVKCKLPNTVNVQYPNLVAMPQSTAWSLFANGGFGGGFGYGFGNGYGNGFFG